MDTMAQVRMILLEKARKWWAHRDLRKAGKIREAAQRENADVASTVEDLERTKASGGYLMAGRGTWTLYVYADNTGSQRIEGYGGIKAETPQCAILMGIPVIDMSTVQRSTVALPLIGIDPADIDPAPWESLSRAPLRTVATAYAALGATLHNIERDPDLDPGDFLGASQAEQDAIVAFARGDTAGLARAMTALR